MWPGDDAAHAVLAFQHLAGDLAVAVQLVYRHQLLVGRHLENAVGAGVDDEGVLLHRLFTVVLEHLRAGIGLVAEHLVAGLFLERMDQLLREAVGEGGQRFRADDTGDLPMADGGILAHALLLQPGKGTHRSVGLLPRRHAVDVEQAQLLQVGAVEIRVLRDCTEGVGARIAKGGGVRLCADAKAVQNDQKDTFFHRWFSISSLSVSHGKVRLISGSIISKSSPGCKGFPRAAAPYEILTKSLQSSSCPIVSNRL